MSANWNYSKWPDLAKILASRVNWPRKLRWWLLLLPGGFLLITALGVGATAMVLVAQTECSRFEISTSGQLIFLVGGLGLTVLAVLFLRLLAHILESKILQPLTALQTGLEQIGQSNFDFRLETKHQDNPDRLFAAFNDMAGRLGDHQAQTASQLATMAAEVAEYRHAQEALQQAYDALKRHNELLMQILGVGHLLQRNLNPGSLFQEIVQAVHYSLGFEMVVLSLVDEESNQVRPRAYVGLDEAQRQSLAEAIYSWEDFAILLQERYRMGRCYFFPNDGFNNEFEGSDSAQISPEVSFDHLDKTWHPDDALLVPVELRPGQVAGIFSLGQPVDGRRPDLHMIQTLEIFAGQAATAIENARLYEQVQQDLIERQRAAEELRKLNERLEDRVRDRTTELAQTNQTLQTEILERRRAEEQIRTSLKEKEMLLQEIHHRVKNNLQVISSLLNLQAGYIESEDIRDIFRDSQNRVRSMALVHEKLYRSDDLARIDLAEYIRNLATFLFSSYRAGSALIKLEVQAEDVLLGIDAAVPCGLMLNELISNALKHAFPNGRSGQIRVELGIDADRQVILVVSDNGVGFPADFDFENGDSLGMQLVDTLVDQLDGTLEILSREGSEFRITFPDVSP